MNSTGKINELRTSLESLKKAGKTIGLVPTMGNLHDGHINLVKESLEKILNRGMLNKWLGPYRDECIIGENFDFIKFHNDSVAEHLRNSPYLPVPYETGFGKCESV